MYIVVKGTTNVTGTTNTNKRNKRLSFGNNAPFNTFVDNTEEFDIIMLMYNYLEYSDNYSMTSAS